MLGEIILKEDVKMSLIVLLMTNILIVAKAYAVQKNVIVVLIAFKK